MSGVSSGPMAMAAANVPSSAAPKPSVSCRYSVMTGRYAPLTTYCRSIRTRRRVRCGEDIDADRTWCAKLSHRTLRLGSPMPKWDVISFDLGSTLVDYVVPIQDGWARALCRLGYETSIEALQAAMDATPW